MRRVIKYLHSWTFLPGHEPYILEIEKRNELLKEIKEPTFGQFLWSLTPKKEPGTFTARCYRIIKRPLENETSRSRRS